MAVIFTVLWFLETHMGMEPADIHGVLEYMRMGYQVSVACLPS